MEGDENYRRKVRIATVIIVVVSIVGVSLIAIVSAPGINLFSPYEQFHADMTITPPSAVYNISVGANNSNLQVYQGGNNSIYIDLTASGWLRLSSSNVYMTKEVTNNSVAIFIHTPTFVTAFTSTAKVYLPSQSTASYLSLATSNGNENLFGPLNAVNMSMTTSNGNIGTAGLTNGTVDASSVNGNINIIAQYLTSSSEDTVNGNIQLTLGDPVSSGTYSLDSVNGNQHLYISRNSNATLDASTVNGNIYVTNLSIDTSLSSSRAIQGTINGGGAMIKMKASNGNISITGT